MNSKCLDLVHTSSSNINGELPGYFLSLPLWKDSEFTLTLSQMVSMIIVVLLVPISSTQPWVYPFLSIGNYNGDVLTGVDVYLMTIIPCAIYFIFFIFFLIWTAHYNSCITQEDESAEFVKPEKFCVEVEGFESIPHIKEEDLEYFFASFGPVYEVSLVRQFENKLSYF